MAVLVRTCCCGCTLRVGILLIGIFGLVLSAYSVYSQSLSIQTLKQAEEDIDSYTSDLPVDKKYMLVVIRLSYANLAFRVIRLLVNLLLLGSFCEGNIYLAVPWLVWTIFELFYSLGVTIFLITVWHGFAIIFVVGIIGWLLSIYFIIVVYSYIEALREDPTRETAGFPASMRSGNQTQMVTVTVPQVGMGHPPPYAPSGKATV